MLKRIAVALLALLLSAAAASPAGAHRGPPGHDHAESQPPTQNVSDGANDMAMVGGGAAASGGAAATGLLAWPVFAGVTIIAAAERATHHWYDGYTGPSDQAGRNQPTPSRVPPSAHG